VRPAREEGGVSRYFGSVFTGGTVSVALLVWRFITFICA